MKKPIYTAMVMAAGSGTRMHSDVKKQFMELCGMPVAAHSIKAFQENESIRSIVLVIPKGCSDESLNMCIKYGFTKVKNIVEGSDERFKSVYNGLLATPSDTDYVLIHDGVRPMIDQELINRCCRYVQLTRACVAAVPVTDTIKLADKDGFAARTLDRKLLWSIQTPQSFSYPLLLDAYKSLYETIQSYGSDTSVITDDAVIVENMSNTRVRIIRGDVQNIKITTPGDMIIAKAFLEDRAKKQAEEEEKRAEAERRTAEKTQQDNQT